MSGSPYAMFKTDKKLETDGIILDYGDFKIKIARAGGNNTKYAEVLKRVSKPYRKAIEKEVLSEEIGRKILIEVFAEVVVIGWDGVLDEKGKPLTFSPANAKKLLNDLPDLFADIQEQASKASNFRQEELEEAAKN